MIITIFTDFGHRGPYVGLMRAVLEAGAPGVPVIDLMHDAPRFRPAEAGILLAALAPWLPAPAVVLAVVDPGVGTRRKPMALKADGRWFVGPDNGLLDPMAAAAAEAEAWDIAWRPEHLSASFHGRDLFAPVAARLARGEPLPGSRREAAVSRTPEDLACVIYIDDFGNAMTGLRASSLASGTPIRAAGRVLRHARTFGEVPRGEAFWYANSLGLLEIAANQADAARLLGLSIGSPVEPAHIR
jgi:S-adenosylmethionine hydrolase